MPDWKAQQNWSVHKGIYMIGEKLIFDTKNIIIRLVDHKSLTKPDEYILIMQASNSIKGYRSPP
jgi:hypothetical protein